MTKAKKIFNIILILFILAYYILGIYINNETYAIAGIRSRDTDLSKLNNEQYPGFAALIDELKTAHPNWTFTILYTGINWNDALYNETTAYHGKSLTQNTSREWLCTDCNPDMSNLHAYEPGWYCASQAAVAYYMDARNWLNDDYIFAFEGLTYDPSIQNIEGVNKILKGSFMDVASITYIDTSGNTQVIDKSYAQIIMEAAAEYNVSPYHLASRLRQEQGSGNSGLISGNFTYTDPATGEYYNYTGYYNYFNVNASGSTTAKIIINGLKYASSDKRAFKWTSPELAIKGGAQFLANNYIGKCQDTIYLQKYCVDDASPYSLYSNQYMQNISAPYTEGNSMKNAYESIGALDNQFNFVIPVYENMPQEASKRPSNNTTVVVQNVQTTASYLRIRTGPSINYNAISGVPEGTTLLRIETANAPAADGNYWDKVVYNTGTEIIIGYSSRSYLIDIPDVVSCNEQDTTRTSVNLRNGPGTVSTTIIKTLSADVNVTIIDKIPYAINNHIWYRIKLEDGTQGYIASTYLKSNTPATPDEPTTPDVPPVSDKYKVEGNYIKISPSMQISDLPQDAILYDSILKTGANITINGQSYIAVMLGDVNEDGSITPADYVKIKNNIMGTTNLEEKNKIAADTNSDGNVTPADYVKVKNHIMGVSSIAL